MKRHVAAVVVVLCLAPSWLSAQTAQITIDTASANVHKGPSTGSPVIGTAPRGTVLEVTRQLGDWVKVSWPSAPDAAGYIRRTAGSMAEPATPSRSQVMTSSPARASLSPASLTTDVPVDHSTSAGQPVTNGTSYITPPPHVVGLGGRVSGSSLGFGATGRAWSKGRVGAQLGISRYALTSTTAPGRVTSLQFAPSVLYALRDRITGYAWVRPYVGAGANLSRSTQIGFGTTNKLGFQAFGGGEVTLPNVPRFAVSADLGYQWLRAPFDGFELGGLGFTLAGHWYVR